MKQETTKKIVYNFKLGSVHLTVIDTWIQIKFNIILHCLLFNFILINYQKNWNKID